MNRRLARYVAVLFFVLFCAALLLAQKPSSAGAKRPITERDLFRFTWIGDPQFSPEGSQVAFVRVVVNEKKDGYDTSIWSVDIKSGQSRQLTAGPHDTSPKFSPDGSRLAFVRSIDKDNKPQPPQIYILSMTGGEGWQLTKLPKGASQPTWSPDGKTLAFNSPTNAQDLAKEACKKAKEGEAGTRKDDKPGEIGGPGQDEKDASGTDQSKNPSTPGSNRDACKTPEHESDVKVITRAVYRINGAGYLDFSHPDHIWTIAVPPNPQLLPEPKQLTSGDFSEEEIVWAADGSKVYFTSTRDLEPYYHLQQNAVYSVPASGGPVTEVTRIAGTVDSPAISRDGKRMAFFGQLNQPVRSYAESDLWVVDLSPGATPRNLTENYDREVGGEILGDQEPPRGRGGVAPIWSGDGRSVIALVEHQGRANLERFDASTGQATPVTTGDQAVEEYSATPDGSQLVAEISNPTNVNDLFLVNGSGGAKRLTNVNEKLFSELNLTPPEEIWYTSFDGRKMQGWVQKPADFDPHKKYPLILNIHGGPHAAHGYVFFHEMQWMAAKGYVVLYPNPRGSTSYGQEFGNIIQYHYPGDDFKDLMAGVDELIRRGYVDDKRLGVTGGSGGGLLTNWVVGHTDRFAAAVSQRDIASWADWWYTADFTLFQPNWFRKPPFEDAQDYTARSPITYIEDVKTPLMLILGDADYRTPPGAGGEEMFRALKFRRIPTAMVRFPGESHELSRSGQPWHRIERLHHIVNWFDVYLQGKKTHEYDLVPQAAQ
jgi:dipeptidyl aminopeptidase/acylaminoacyl peptidase